MGPKEDGCEETKGEEESAMGKRCLGFCLPRSMGYVRMGGTGLAIGNEIHCTIIKSVEKYHPEEILAICTKHMFASFNATHDGLPPSL